TLEIDMTADGMPAAPTFHAYMFDPVKGVHFEQDALVNAAEFLNKLRSAITYTSDTAGALTGHATFSHQKGTRAGWAVASVKPLPEFQNKLAEVVLLVSFDEIRNRSGTLVVTTVDGKKQRATVGTRMQIKVELPRAEHF